MSLTCIAVFLIVGRKSFTRGPSYFIFYFIFFRKMVYGLYLLHCFILGVYVSLVTKGMDTCALKGILVLYHIAEAAASM